MPRKTKRQKQINSVVKQRKLTPIQNVVIGDDDDSQSIFLQDDVNDLIDDDEIDDVYDLIDAWRGELDLEYVKVQSFLKWIPVANESIPGRAPHSGDSQRSQFRNKAKQCLLSVAAKEHSTVLTNFFAPPTQTNSYDDADCDNDANAMSYVECLASLKKLNLASISANVKFDNSSNYEHLQYLVIQRYYIILTTTNYGKMKASRQASLLLKLEISEYLCRCIRRWAQHYSIHSRLEIRRQGNHTKTFLPNESVRVCLSWSESNVSYWRTI